MLGCAHDVWKRFDIGFDKGWCCARCKREQSEPMCRCGHLARWVRSGDEVVFDCMFSRCAFRKVVPVSDHYLKG